MKVAIVGAAKGSQMLAPFDDPTWNIWVLGNQLMDYDGKAINQVFEIHDDLSEHKPEYPQWLIDNAPRLVVGPEFPIKTSHKDLVVYPTEEINKMLGGEFLSSSVAFMIAFAIYKGATEIGLWGVDMAVDDHEYFKQRPDVYAWLGYARGKGIKITIPPECPIFKSTYNEGRDWGKGENIGPEPFTVRNLHVMSARHRKRVEELKAQKEDIEAQINGHIGAAQAFDQMGRISRAVASGAIVNTLDEVTRLG